jgi:hypothetical protein
MVKKNRRITEKTGSCHGTGNPESRRTQEEHEEVVTA